MKIAIVKPDHLGDLVLSAPAIRAVLSRYSDLTLFVSSRNIGFAGLLFGAVELRPLDLPHLARGDENSQGGLDFTGFDLVLFLRRDQILNPQQAHMVCNDYIFLQDSNQYHQTLLDYMVASRVVGSYDIDAAFYSGNDRLIRQKATRPPDAVGLCIGAGFHANSWPATNWVELGRELQAGGRRVAVIGGPSETNLAQIIARALGLADQAVISGDDDYQAFLERVAELDWVVASDGGTAHLCSLVAPILSIFGGSPFRRYAPFGRWNRLVTLELPCSPCCQYMSRAINGCLSTECVTGINPAQILHALGTPYKEIFPSSVEAGDGCRLYFGTSHLDRAQLGAA
jgi:heptosyltransferase-2